MRFAQLRAAAALVGVSQAFLLPPEISAEDTDIIKTLPFEDAVAIDGRVMEINCPGCPVVTNIEGKMHSAQVDSILQLNFTVSHDAFDRLFLNGLQIYPLDSHAAFMEPLTASQMIKASDNTWQYASTPKLGYSLSVRHPATSSNQDQLDVVAIHLEIVEVADKFLSGMPSIELKLLETPSGKLMIGDAQITAPKSPASKPTDDGQECTTILCKWRAIVADKISKLKGCGSKSRPEPARVVSFHGKHHGDHSEHSHPRPHGPHRPYRHHHRHGGFARFLRGVVLHVFIPVLIGIMVGITASLIGMVVGHIAIFVWRLLFRRGQQARYTRVQQDDAVIEESNDETKSFLDHQGPPPVYPEPPVYTEADEKTSE